MHDIGCRSAIPRRAVAAVLALVGMAAMAVGLAPARASTAPPPTISYEILWNLIDNSGCPTTQPCLVVQSTDAVGNKIGYLTQGVNTVAVICQANNGSTADGMASHTWDQIWWSNRVAWVYDHYIDTPAQVPPAWYSGPGPNDDGQGAPKHPC